MVAGVSRNALLGVGRYMKVTQPLKEGERSPLKGLNHHLVARCVLYRVFFLLKKSQKTTTLYLHSRVQRYTSRSRNGDIMGLTVIEDPYFRSEVGLMFMFFYSPALRSVVTVVHRPNRQEYWCTVI